MSKMRIVKMATIIIAFVLLFVGGVSASWLYPVNTISGQFISVKPTAFTWEGSDILPDDSQNSIGENHISLVNNILFEIKYGLNASAPLIKSTNINSTMEVF